MNLIDRYISCPTVIEDESKAAISIARKKGLEEATTPFR